MDRNTTGHIAVAANPKTGKIWKLGKGGLHIHKKYSNIRRTLQKQGKYRKVKQIKNRESRIVKNLNHKISRKYGELSFSDIMSELEIDAKDSGKLVYHLTQLQKAALVKNEYVKKDSSQVYSYYDVTELGESVLSNLMNVLKVKKEE